MCWKPRDRNMQQGRKTALGFRKGQMWFKKKMKILNFLLTHRSTQEINKPKPKRKKEKLYFEETT